MVEVRGIVLPGDEIPIKSLPLQKTHNRPVTLGPGLRHAPPSTLRATLAGSLSADARKNAIWIEGDGGRYTPSPNDLVIAQVTRSTQEFYQCSLTPHAPTALLPHLAFEGATKKTRPMLSVGALVYARVVSASPQDADVELSCVATGSGRADGLGPLKGGNVWSVSRSFARRLLLPGGDDGGQGQIVILSELGARGLRFEVAVGRNGKVWIAGENVNTTIKVGRALVEADRQRLGVREQRDILRRIIRQACEG